MIGIIAVLTAREGHGDQLGAALIDGAKLVRENEPGCRFYQVTRSRADGCVFKLFEVYESQAALDAHSGTAHFAQIRTALAAHLGAPPQVEFLDVIG